MGDIKSTLDLVMEKTEPLTLSDKEKAEQRLAEAKKKIYGHLYLILKNLVLPRTRDLRWARILYLWPQAGIHIFGFRFFW